MMADVLSYLKLCAEVTYPPQYVAGGGAQEPLSVFHEKYETVYLLTSGLPRHSQHFAKS